MSGSFRRMFASIMKILIAISGGCLIGFALAVYVHFSAQLPEILSVQKYEPPLITNVYDRNGELLAEFAYERRIIVPLSQIPNVMKNAIISVEDDRFYSHHGVDLLGILRAAWSNYLAGEVVQGGSTITQQLAKSLFLTRERSWQRKIKEAILSYRLEEMLTKNRILELYLNQVYFGSGAYGIEAAAHTYFNKSCASLTLVEAAMLAGLPKAPSRFSPLRNETLARERRNHVLQRMYQNGSISEAELRSSQSADLGITPGKRSPNRASYFVEVLRRQLESEYGASVLYTSGMKIFTTLDWQHQAIAEEAVRWGLHEIGKKRPWRGPVVGKELTQTPPDEGQSAIAQITSIGNDWLELMCGGLTKRLPFKEIWVKNADLLTLKPGDLVGFVIDEYEDPDHRIIKKCHISQEPDVEAALLSLNPSTGEVVAWVGGYDFSRSQFDRVSQMKRQPGSAFKPFIYTAALDNGYTPADVVYDTPIMVEQSWRAQSEWEDESLTDQGPDENPITSRESGRNDDEGITYWKPQNYSQEFYGATTLRDGLSQSRNIMSIHLLGEVGIPNVIRIARQMGIQSSLTETLSLALGASEVSLLELTKAYGVFASIGTLAEPMMIDVILDRNDQIIREYYPSLRRALRSTTAYLSTDLLCGVVEHGTGYAANRLQRPTGGKTGTTNNNHDAWFMGFTPQLVTGTWVGLDVLEPIYARATGAEAALPIWLRYMEQVVKDMEKKEFPIPDGIISVRICSRSGLLVTPGCEKSVQESFCEGTEPIERCNLCSPKSISGLHETDVNWDSPASDLRDPSTPDE